MLAIPKPIKQYIAVVVSTCKQVVQVNRWINGKQKTEKPVENAFTGL